jgi:hypothetical protein
MKQNNVGELGRPSGSTLDRKRLLYPWPGAGSGGCIYAVNLRQPLSQTHLTVLSILRSFLTNDAQFRNFGGPGIKLKNFSIDLMAQNVNKLLLNLTIIPLDSAIFPVVTICTFDSDHFSIYHGKCTRKDKMA